MCVLELGGPVRGGETKTSRHRGTISTSLSAASPTTLFLGAAELQNRILEASNADTSEVISEVKRLQNHDEGGSRVALSLVVQ